jgi:hypothetical protein
VAQAGFELPAFGNVFTDTVYSDYFAVGISQQGIIPGNKTTFPLAGQYFALKMQRN